MTDPTDQGFELNGVLFGQGGQILVEDFTPGSIDKRTQDAEQSQGDARLFGAPDRKTPGTWGWALGINRETENEALETLEVLEAAWDAPATISAVRYRIGGRTRRIYGRPGRFVYDVLDTRRLAGYIAVSTDFRRADPLHYDDVEQGVTLGLQPASTGGLVSPLISPLTSLNDGTGAGRLGSIIVSGSAPTPVIIEITGQVTRPWVQATGQWRVSLDGNIASGNTVTLDAHPWELTCLHANGGSAAGLLRGTSLTELLLPPGAHEITFGGTSSGAASATVRWRGASRSL